MSCVPLLAKSLLTPSIIPETNKLLDELLFKLQDVQASEHPLTPPLISYVFFPLSSLLRRNPLANIPDQTLEKILANLAVLCEAWWWDMDEATWEQIFMFCSAVIGGMDGKGKGKMRDDEALDAAARCLYALLRKRDDDKDSLRMRRATAKFSTLQAHARRVVFIPILGQTLNTLLTTAQSQHLSLQRSSLKTLHALIDDYLPDDFVPSVLPGVMSSMTKVALGIKATKGWSNGDIVAEALFVMRGIIVRSVGDDACAREGAIRVFSDLEDLTNLDGNNESTTTPRTSPYSTPRTPSWLRGSVSQLHIAINTLTPLVKHPTPSALFALASFSASVLSSTAATMPQSQPLLLSFLLSLSGSSFSSVAAAANHELRQLLSPPSTARHSLLQVLTQISRDSLAALPRMMLSHADEKVEHVAGVIEAVCHLATTDDASGTSGLSSISLGVGKLLGPTGGIEKWGWSLLSVLDFIDSPITTAPTSAAQLKIESDSSTFIWAVFPDLELKNVSSRSAHSALERMFRSLGHAAGDKGLFAVEWFVSVAQAGRGPRAVAALWCACRLLEGIAHVTLAIIDPQTSVSHSRSIKTQKIVRGLARRVTEFWDTESEDGDIEPPGARESSNEGVAEEDHVLVEHVKGLVTIRGVGQTNVKDTGSKPRTQLFLHRSLSLQMLSITAGILEARFNPLLLYALYPILHSIVSTSTVVSDSGLAALHYISNATSYASPANFLLSNFDYALDAVSRRLTRRWLDLDATKVLLVLVRLTGRDVVSKAGDVIEECFDRLDEFHGYEVIVDGLVEVLGEVVREIGEDESNQLQRDTALNSMQDKHDHPTFGEFFEWYTHRHDQMEASEEDIRDPSYPREAWGNKNDKTDENEEKAQAAPPDDEAPPTPTQALTKQIVSRSLYFLTHNSPTIRAHILKLLSAAVPVLPESALLPSIHHAWPFILNRLSDQEVFVVSATTTLIEALTVHVGSFMFRRVWNDLWPRFRDLLRRLEKTDSTSTLVKREYTRVGTESAYTSSHRLYRSLLKTMTATALGVQPQDSTMWEVITMFRRFLHKEAHQELQACARELYKGISTNNEDAVWLALFATTGEVEGSVGFLKENKWDIRQNVALLFEN